jgi:hypothetical protein
MKTNLILLRITGFICLLFALFHLAFSRLFSWDTALACLTTSDRAIMLTYHYISILILGFMTLVLFFQPRTLLHSNLKYSVLGMFILFFAIRIFTEFSLFGFFPPRSYIIILMCGLPVIMMTIPLTLKQPEHENNKTI